MAEKLSILSHVVDGAWYRVQTRNGVTCAGIALVHAVTDSVTLRAARNAHDDNDEPRPYVSESVIPADWIAVIQRVENA